MHFRGMMRKGFQDVNTISAAIGQGTDMLAARKASRAVQDHSDRSWRQNAALVLPHVGLVTMTLIYITCGSVVFYLLESPNNVEEKSKKISEILETQKMYMSQLYDKKKDLDEETWKQLAREKLQRLSEITMDGFAKEQLTDEQVNENRTISNWSFGSAVFFSTVVMTTIGYGNNVPRTKWGKIFCLFYALFGIPLALVTIADLSKFISILIGRASKFIKHMLTTKVASNRFFATGARIRKRLTERINRATNKADPTKQEFSNPLEIKAPSLPISPRTVLLILLSYTAFGALIFGTTQRWPYEQSYYFCFITMTTIGFGDLVPKDKNVIMMFVNLVYILFGLVLTTMSIDIVGSHYIREIHFVGRKINNMKELIGLLGGKAATVGDVMSNMRLLQRHYGITDEQVASLLSHPEFRNFVAQPREPELPPPQLLHPGESEDEKPYVPWNIERFRYIDSAKLRSECSSLATTIFDSNPIVHRRRGQDASMDWSLSYETPGDTSSDMANGQGP